MLTSSAESVQCTPSGKSAKEGRQDLYESAQSYEDLYTYPHQMNWHRVSTTRAAVLSVDFQWGWTESPTRLGAWGSPRRHASSQNSTTLLIFDVGLDGLKGRERLGDCRWLKALMVVSFFSRSVLSAGTRMGELPNFKALLGELREGTHTASFAQQTGGTQLGI
ncbi:hypothetical protein R1flu_004212 [Riccia fluitans]|uniref:Uncharacterized protein n=1 Tax=Riccia fluitans TaxID=41844 RepID=A0ABD1YPM8_9MARC